MAKLVECAPDLLARADAKLLSGETNKEAKAILQQVLESYRNAASLLSKSGRAREVRRKVFDLCEAALRTHLFGGVPIHAACRHVGLDEFVPLGKPKTVLAGP